MSDYSFPLWKVGGEGFPMGTIDVGPTDGWLYCKSFPLPFLTNTKMENLCANHLWPHEERDIVFICVVFYTSQYIFIFFLLQR